MISQKYPLIVAAITAALASGYADAIPSLGQAAAPTVALVVAGSSAAESSVASAFENDVCGGVANTLLVGSAGGSGNFFAFSCNTSAAVSATGLPTIPSGTLVTLYYRTEGGSVVGALPIVGNTKIKRINLGDTTDCVAAGTTFVCSITGTTATSGTLDNWGGATTPDFVQLGVTDVEPAQLTGNDFPTNYSPAAFGTATPAQLKALPTSRIFDQVFGLVVNTKGESFTSVNIGKDTAANILSLSETDWNSVPDVNGNPVSSVTTGDPITRIDREPGSGTRTSTNIYFFNYQCGSTNSITNNGSEQLNFSTTDELTQANNTPGSIAYTSIDQVLNPTNHTKFPNLALVSINGVAPTNKAAAAGAYGFWFEATFVPNSTALGSGTQSATLAAFLESELPELNKAPASTDIDVIPLYKGNSVGVPLIPNTAGTTSTNTIYINAFTRGTSSCNLPAEQN